MQLYWILPVLGEYVTLYVMAPRFFFLGADKRTRWMGISLVGPVLI